MRSRWFGSRPSELTDVMVAALEREAAEDAASIAELEAKRARREQIRAAAEAEAQRLARVAEAAQIVEEAEKVGAALRERGEAVRAAFDLLAECAPELIALQDRYDALQRRADSLRQEGTRFAELPRVARYGRMDYDVLRFLLHAGKSQQAVDDQRHR